jgi:Zn-dependent protease with chaperone function
LAVSLGVLISAGSSAYADQPVLNATPNQHANLTVAFSLSRQLYLLPGLLGLPGDLSLPARMVILGFIGSLVLFPLTPLSAWRSRCHEREADRFASDLTGRPQDLASALVKLSVENLSNLFPHPWYAAFYYSHPPAVERVRSLRPPISEVGANTQK